MKVCIYIDSSKVDQHYQTTIKMLKVDLLLAKHEPCFVDFAQMGNSGFSEDVERLVDAYIVTPCGMNGTAKFYQHLNLKDVGDHNKPLIVYNFNGDFDSAIKHMGGWYSTRMATQEEINRWYTVAKTSEDILCELKK